MIFLYVLFPVLLLILWVMARKTTLPPDMEERGIARQMLKVSAFIFHLIPKKNLVIGGNQVRSCLQSLHRKKNIAQIEEEYYIRKISIVLVMALAGSFLSALMYLSSAGSSAISEDNSLFRNEFGDGDYETHLVASSESGTTLLEYDLTVKEREYTKEELDELFPKAEKELEKIMLAGNESFDLVTEDLDLAEKVPGYPFTVSWRLDNYELMHYDGRIELENLPQEGAIVRLDAIFKYGDYSYEQVYYAKLVQKELSAQELLEKEIKKLLKKADEDSQNISEIRLPDTMSGKKIIWSEKRSDSSIMILMLTLIGGAASYVFKDKELKDRMEKRNREMLSDYPQLVSQMVLYLGAGMTMRNIFEKLSNNYQKRCRSGEPSRYVYEEVTRTNRELAGGVYEADAYEQFGLRCGGQQYTRLCTLLSQNLRKGNSELLKSLQEESRKAFEERLDQVRKLGEEAGTKLLLPMIMMLIIVMIIIMIPAYLSF